jgi:hypothetical protein
LQGGINVYVYESVFDVMKCVRCVRWAYLLSMRSDYLGCVGNMFFNLNAGDYVS